MSWLSTVLLRRIVLTSPSSLSEPESVSAPESVAGCFRFNEERGNVGLSSFAAAASSLVFVKSATSSRQDLTREEPAIPIAQRVLVL